MNKKIKAKVEEKVSEKEVAPLVEATPVVEVKEKITPMTVNLGREDLNQLASKINEVIAHINSK